MKKNKIQDLRDHLFSQIEKLDDDETPLTDLDIEKAKTIAQLASVVVQSAKVEVDFLRAASTRSINSKDDGTGFIPYRQLEN